MKQSLVQYYRCPERFVKPLTRKASLKNPGYFRFGKEVVCYGRSSNSVTKSPTDTLHDALGDVRIENGTVYLTFDSAEIAKNLRTEVYAHGGSMNEILNSPLARAYYFVRPILPVSVRKHVQRIRLVGWNHLTFPKWPVDRTVDSLFEQLMILLLRAQRLEKIPFIWFWPNGAPSCAIMTHDVETACGLNFCPSLMDIDDNYGIKASFQIVPEDRYPVDFQLLDEMRRRGFEVNIHDLNHDGRLFADHQEFLNRVKKINAYGEKFVAKGFRAAVLYRNQRWFDALEFSYDMSVPNVGHLDPQRGGCCTVMPYFVGNVLELPVTTIQEYSLFHILNDYSIDLWKEQIELIMQKNGLISFIIHPDYVTQEREKSAFESLLAHLSKLRTDRGIWIPTPGEVNRWWRERAEMKLIETVDGFKIEGRGSERARIAYASEFEGRLKVTVENTEKAVAVG
jgi:hypothetical protein